MMSWLDYLLLIGNAVLVVILLLTEVRKVVLKVLIDVLKSVPFVQSLIDNQLKSEVKKIMKHDLKIKNEESVVKFPEIGESVDSLKSQLSELQTTKTDKMFAYVYSEARRVLGDSLHEIQNHSVRLYAEEGSLSKSESEVDNVVQLARLYGEAFMHENALNPTLFRALRKFEVEVVAMTAEMLNGDGNVRGNVTSGGTESILMAVKTYRDYGKKMNPGNNNPNMVIPTTGHPAFHKAAHYFGLSIKLVSVDSTTGLPSIQDYRSQIDSETILLVASAPQYCHGIIDPIPELSQMAVQLGLPLHVDACFGGFMLPWIQKLNYKVTSFDFSNPGVTSISADLHKYGFAPKGASVIVYRNGDIRKHQLFAYCGWPGGLFGSPTMAGTRPGGHLASSWVTMKSLGKSGYMKIAQQLMELTQFWIQSIKEIQSLDVVGKPQMTAFAIKSTSLEINIFVMADLMEEKGWSMERQMGPDCLHCTILPQHLAQKEQFINDLKECVQKILDEKIQPKGLAAVYGMVTKIPSESLLKDFLLEFFNELYS